MATRMRDLKVFEGLAIVTVDGFEAEREEAEGYLVTAIDPPGSANFLCDAYGMDGGDFTGPGILWTDYDLGAGWRFSVLIAADEVEDFKAAAEEGGYTVESIEPVTEPTHYGDGNGTVEILRHRDGWVVIE